MFSEKLDFLMSITGISGGELAHAISLDPSYISRLRHGKRDLPKGQHFMNSLAYYFAEHIRTDYQKKLLCDAMGYMGEWPEDKKIAEKHIFNWLLVENSVQRELIQGVIERLAISIPTDFEVSVEEDIDCDAYRSDSRELYYGTEGKREAFLRFLTLAVNASTTAEMYLYSDQDMAWLSDDPDFAKKTLSLITTCAKQGKKIKIIHSLRQDVEEMLYTVRRWMPIYLTGYVEPYYYPKIRDELYYRTSFVIPGIAAMGSSSIKGNLSEGMTLFYTEPKAVSIVEAELKQLLLLSKPLAKVYSTKSNEGFWPMLKEFIFAQADTIMLHETPCPYFKIRSLWKIKDKIEGFNFEIRDFENMLKHYKFTEIVSKPDPQKLCDGMTPLQFSEISYSSPKYLSREECIENWTYIIDLMERRENYNLIIRQHSFPNMFICVKEGIGILLYKPGENAIAFYIQQSNVVDATWEFLKSITGYFHNESKKDFINELGELLKSLG